MVVSQWIPLQASSIDSREFFAIGGFASLNSLEVSTTGYNNLIKQNPQFREKSLDAVGAFLRMRESAQASATRKNYWHGQVAYFHLVSFPWQLRRKHFMKAVSRLMFTLLAFTLSVHHMSSLEFWRSALLPHYNLVRTTLAGMDSQLYSKTTWQR
jgi:hypothetical protein